MEKAFVLVFALMLLMNFSFVFAEGQPWDALRPLDSFAQAINPLTTWIVFLLAAVLMFLSVTAWLRKKEKRFLFVALAFVFFFLKWLLALLDIYLSPGRFFSWAGGTIVELLIFLCLFLALFKR
ncbi:MAG: hypothetical protein NT067_04200 [Candidatus Diapherotrites archaeon]|nr:hypothetical protein [Candidatus Diapherotrites archaeon]